MNSLPADGELRQAWEEASARVDRYLIALGVDDPVLRNRILTKFIGQTRSATLQHPTEAAMSELFSALDAWFDQVLESPNGASHGKAVEGCLGLFVSQVNGDWSRSFLDGRVPDTVHQALNGIHLQSAPEWWRSRMVPQRVDVSPIANEAWDKLDRIPVSKVAAIASAVLGSLSTHFSFHPLNP